MHELESQQRKELNKSNDHKSRKSEDATVKSGGMPTYQSSSQSQTIQSVSL